MNKTKNQVLLSVCIPTYNRAHLLPQVLHSVVGSIKNCKTDNVEILISDNASTDDTQNVIANLKLEYPFIKSRRNEKNVVDENFFICAKSATGEFIWVFADDDLMEPDAIDIVLNEISKDVNVLLLNFSMWNKDFSKQIKPSHYQYKVDKTYTNHNEILTSFGNGLQYISSVVFNKSYFFIERNFNYKNLHQYGNSFAYALYVSLFNNPKFKFISQPILKYRGFNANEIQKVNIWYKFFIYGNEVLFKILKDQGYSNSSIRSARSRIIKHYLNIDITGRKLENYNTLQLLKKIPQTYYFHFSFLLIGLPIILMPRLIFLPIYRFLKKMKN